MSAHLEIVELKPWLLEVWELLPTKAPCPDKCRPYCCYWKTVIFYVRPWTVRPWHRIINSPEGRKAYKPGKAFEQWDQVETELTWDSVIVHNAERFIVGGGSVRWKAKRWWMKHSARRERLAA